MDADPRLEAALAESLEQARELDADLREIRRRGDELRRLRLLPRDVGDVPLLGHTVDDADVVDAANRVEIRAHRLDAVFRRDDDDRVRRPGEKLQQELVLAGHRRSSE
ncbi:hypothetical protein ACFQJD_07290 [Haloplanus sp. GCM10025708]|uniref:hypothetical protein n=1 Tax=Haloplanus sp. GCM10025708 TaxID=3252679 RepID=UPI0036227840